MREKVTVESGGVTTTRTSVWDGQQLVAEQDSDGTLYRYLWGPDRTPLALEVISPSGASSLYYYHTDAAGSVVAITSLSSDSPVATYTYDAFGAVTSVGGSNLALAERNPLRYRAYYYDEATSLYYLPARYYEPSTARFLSPDPAPPSAGDPLSLNAYTYCQGNPVNLEDSNGARHEMGGHATRVHDDAVELAKGGHLKEAKNVQKYYKQRLARAYAMGYGWRDANYPAYSQAEYYAKGIRAEIDAAAADAAAAQKDAFLDDIQDGLSVVSALASTAGTVCVAAGAVSAASVVGVEAAPVALGAGAVFFAINAGASLINSGITFYRQETGFVDSNQATFSYIVNGLSMVPIVGDGAAIGGMFVEISD
jgi:RHS repeat-associated protein